MMKSTFTSKFLAIFAYYVNGLDKIGFILGTKYKINNKNSLDLYYKYVNFDEDEDETNSHIIGIGYSHKF